MFDFEPDSIISLFLSQAHRHKIFICTQQDRYTAQYEKIVSTSLSITGNVTLGFISEFCNYSTLLEHSCTGWADMPRKYFANISPSGYSRKWHRPSTCKDDQNEESLGLTLSDVTTAIIARYDVLLLRRKRECGVASRAYSVSMALQSSGFRPLFFFTRFYNLIHSQ